MGGGRDPPGVVGRPIEELTISIAPVVLGGGKRLFEVSISR
jgi:hypothetical protein